MTDKKFTATQEHQLSFLREIEGSENLTSPTYYDASCDTCSEHKDFKSVDGARSFIQNHRSHKTWIKRVD